MRAVLAWIAVAVGLTGSFGCSADTHHRHTGGTDDAGLPDLEPDEDGDNISDRWEGRPDGVDTNGDGEQDYVDADSDGDGITDAIEGGVARAGLEPRDTDGDGVYDFRDDDSDANGIADATEGGADLDGDGLYDAADPDN